MHEVVAWTTAQLPEDRPRHLLGIGEIDDLIRGVELGIDTFDCAMPTRLGRHGMALVPAPEARWRVDLTAARWSDSDAPIMDGCPCPACAVGLSRGYLRYLLRARELTALRLLTLHNVAFVVRLMARLRAAIAAGTLPDVGQQGQDVTMSFAGAGHLSPLDDTYKELGPQNFVQLQQKDAYVNWKGKFYGLPWYIETRILYYHRDLLDKAGVKPPKLWSEWVDAAKKLTQGEQFGYLHSFEGATAGHVWISLAQSDGGTLLDKDGNIVAADSPGVTEGLQFAGDFYLKHKVMPEAAPTYKGTDVNQLFYLKKVAILYGNGQIIDDLVRTKPDLLPNVGGVLMPINKPDQVTRSFLGGFQLFTFKASKNPEAGLELLKWLFQEPWYTDYTTSTNGAALPVTKAGVSADFFQKNELRKLLVTQEETALRYGGPIYGNTPYMGEAEGKLLFAQALTDLVAGKKSASEAVKALDSGLKELAKSAPT
jgi:ABC-type glycerol-3-phosphate transport system substrate-binding protein